ncbi:CapA family protein [Frankia sp. Cpl3]|nr:CapA family protein [Frankia sp. Cpl3]
MTSPRPAVPTDGRHDPPSGRLLVAGALVLAAAAVGFGLYPDVLSRHLLTVNSDPGGVRIHPDTTARSAWPPSTGGPSGGRDPDRDATELTLIFSGGLLLTAAAAGATLAPLGSLLSSADLAVCQGPALTGAPEPAAEALHRAGFDACATATSHTAQLGDADRRSLLEALDGASINHSGAARDRAEAETLTLLPVHGAQIALLSATDADQSAAPSATTGGDTDGGVDRLDPARILQDAARARDAGADLVIASLDWGDPRSPAPTTPTTPTERQRFAARELLGSPLIDLVVGSGSGAVQPFEVVNGKYVAYGMSAATASGAGTRGNTPGSAPDSARSRDGLLLHVLVRNTGLGWVIAGLTYSPTWTRDDGAVLPVADALDDPGTALAVRSELTASWLRTVAAVTGLGPVDGARPDRAPRHFDTGPAPAAPSGDGTTNGTTNRTTG